VYRCNLKHDLDGASQVWALVKMRRIKTLKA
jgi:hypothetical protein